MFKWLRFFKKSYWVSRKLIRKYNKEKLRLTKYINEHRIKPLILVANRLAPLGGNNNGVKMYFIDFNCNRKGVNIVKIANFRFFFTIF